MERNVEMNKVIKELSKKYNKKEKVIKVMLEKTIKENYNKRDFKVLTEEFYKK